MVSVPFELATDKASYSLEFYADVPLTLYAQHDSWAQLQELTRLESPDMLEGATPGTDDIRRTALALAHRIKRADERFRTECFLANSLLMGSAHPRIVRDLGEMLEETLSMVESGRKHFAPALTDSPAIAREKAIADEFVSGRLVDFLSRSIERIGDALLGEGTRFGEALGDSARPLELRAVEALEAEFSRRTQLKLVNPTADSPDTVEQYMERASQLKKHFQAALFLEQEIQATERRVRNYIAIAAAAVASIVYFLATNSRTMKMVSGISVGATAMLGAAFYALKDRLKELSKSWISSHISRRFGTRSVAVRVPARITPEAPVIERAMESFDVTMESRSDELNPDIGHIRRVAILGYRRRSAFQLPRSSVARLRHLGFSGVKHIFRYDFSPFFPRLDNSSKSVRAYDASLRRVRAIEVQRQYRFPVRVRFQTAKVIVVRTGELVVSKSGITRFVATEPGAPSALPIESQADMAAQVVPSKPTAGVAQKKWLEALRLGWLRTK